MIRLFTGGRLLDPAAGRDGTADLLVDGSRLSRIGPGPAPPDAEVFDLSGCLVLPGFTDLHTHLRIPGDGTSEDLVSGAAAAAAGGFVRVTSMPNTDPPLDTPERIRDLLARAASEARISVSVVGAITQGLAGTRLAPLSSMAQAGAAGFSDDGRWVSRSRVALLAFREAASLGLPILSHAEDPELSRGGTAHEGSLNAAEEIAVARDVLLARAAGARLHLCHVSTALGVEIVRWAKAIGIPVTAEAAPHHLLLCDEDIPGDDGLYKVNPPLRSRDDRAALRAGLADGTIDCIATDHAPHRKAANREARTFASSPFGMTGLETAFAALYTGLVLPGILPLPRLVEAMTASASRILGLPAPSLAPGAEASLVVVDPARERTLDPADVLSKSTNSPFLGRPLYGWPMLTLYRGEIVFQRKSCCIS